MIARLSVVVLSILVSACGQDAVPGAIHVGAGFVDPSGDSPYGSLDWCGEQLWIRNAEGISRVDPANGKRLWSASQSEIETDPSFGNLFDCQGTGDGTVIWMDRYPDHVAWRLRDGSRSGQIRNVRRGVDRDYPLIAFDGNRILALGMDGHQPNADHLPPGHRLMWLNEASVDSALNGSEPTALRFLAKDVALLYTADSAFHGDLIFLLLDTETATAHPIIRNYKALSALLPVSVKHFLQLPAMNPNGKVTLDFTTPTGRQHCSIALLFEVNPTVECRPLKPDEQSLFEKLKSDQWEEMALSPSGNWIAWAVAGPRDNPGEGEVQLYVAPTADLLR